MNEERGGGEDSGIENLSSDSVYIRVAIPDAKTQKCLQFHQTDTVWSVKQKVLTTMGKELKDGMNFGLYQPPMNGRAGKFLDEERLLRDYSLSGPIGFLEFKYKRRVYKLMHMNPRKLKQLHTKSNLKQFLEAVRTSNLEKINRFSIRGLDPNFHEHSTGETPLCIATGLQKPKEVMIALFSCGAHLDFRAKDGQTPMHRAAARGNVEAIKTLLDLGTSANYRDKWGLTPLYNTVCNNTSPLCVELLLHDHATIGTTDDQGWAEVHHACKSGCVQHLEHLLFYGADMNVQNHSGNTPLHVCAAYAQESCARVLLFRGADKSIQNYSNQDAYQLAIISANTELADIIRDFTPDQVVPFQEMPTYNDKRRGTPTTVSTYGTLKRSRSDPRLNLSSSRSYNDLSSSSLYESPSPSTSSNHSENSRFLHHSHNHTTSPSLSSSSSHYQHHNNLNHQQQNQQHQNIYQNHNQISSGDLASISTTSMRRHHSVDSDTSSRSISIASTTGSNSGVGAIRIGGYTTGSTSDGGEAERGDSIVLTRATLAALVQADGENAPRKVVLAKSPQGFGFILRGAKSQVQRASVLEFQPSADFPALQYLESVDEGSMAHKAGLKRGDFILEINGENVMNATHEKTVRLIQETRDTLAMTVVTVRNPPTGDVTHMAGGVHQDGIRTLPHKKKGQFDLGGSTRSEQQRLNAAASRVGVDPNNKTASIKRFSKRITAVDLQDIITRQGSYEPELEKQHQQQSLSRARSQPNLNPEPQGTDVTDQRVTRQGDAAVYSNHIETSLPNGLARTGYVTSTVADVHQHQGARDNAEVVYAVPTKDQPQPDYIDTDSGHNSGSSGDSGNSGYGGLPPHPKYPAPTPPTSKLASSTKVPPPPAGPPPAPPRVPTSASSSSASSHMVQISTAAPSYANISAQLAQQKANGNGSFESSFRPGRDAKLSKEPVATPATASLRRVNRPDNKMSVADAVNMFESTTNSSTSISTSASSTTQGRRQSVSFDDDQMYENAARFAEETPNATVLITNEPEPDYEQNNGSNGFGDAIKMAAMAREQRTQDHSATRNVQETATKEPQDELTAAIARRRNQVERQDNVDVVDVIETRAQRNYNGVSNQNGTAHTGGGGGGSNRLGNISATSTSSISTQSSDAGSERYQRDGTPVRGGGHGDGGDEDNSNFRQMAERARQQWLQQKTNTQQTPPSQHRNNHVDNSSVHSNGHVRTNGLQQQQQQHAANGGIDYNVRSGNTNDVPPPHAPPPPPPPMPSYNQPPAAPPAPPPPPPDHAPPLPPNHPTLPSHNSSAGLRQSNHSSTNMPATSSQQQQILQQSADRKPGIADLAQVIAQKAKQRQAINDSTNGSLNAKLEKQGPAKTTILGQHLLHKSGNTNSNNKVYINGATVDYSSTENQVKSPNAMNGDHGTLNRDMAQLSMADKLKMFDTQQKASGKTGTSRHINGYSSTTTTTTSNVPPPMMSYNGYTTTHTNGNHNNEPPANWPITANGSNDYNHGYTINSKLAQHNHLVNTTAPGVGRAGNSQLADVIQVEAIPPPPLFTSMVPPAYDGAIAAQHAREETSSLVSSVSTLSTLSSVDPELASYHHQQDTIQEESYDSMIAPPPPPPTQFTADQLDFIPPPMGFDNSPPSTLNTNNSSSVAATFAAKPVSAWSVQDVCDWLRSLRQHQHVDMFSRHAINGTKLLQLQRPSLVRLGVIRPSDTIAIEQAIRQLKYQ